MYAQLNDVLYNLSLNHAVTTLLFSDDNGDKDIDYVNDNVVMRYRNDDSGQASISMKMTTRPQKKLDDGVADDDGLRV